MTTHAANLLLQRHIPARYRRSRVGTTQRGIGLVGAVFFMVVVALLTVAITKSVDTGAQSFVVEVLSHNAFLAAESGAQLGVRRIFPAQGTGSCSNQTWNLEAINMRRCTASVACRSETVAGEVFYTVESTGRCTDGGATIAERVVLVRAKS